MSRAALGVIVFLCAVVFSPQGRAVEIQEVVSPGGISAWLVEEHTIPLIAMDFEFRGGAAMDPKGKEGLAYLASGLLDEGAGELKALDFQKRLEERAIRIGFSARMDSFAGSMATLSENSDEAFALLRLALTEPRFDNDAVARVREQILAILKAELERPQTIAMQAWFAQAFKDHPYANPYRGTPQSVARVSAKDLRGFTKRLFGLNSLTIGVVGDIDAQTLGRLLDDTFGDLREQARSQGIRETAPIAQGRMEHVEMDIPQSVAVFGSAGLKRDDPDWYAASVMNYVLGGGGFSSRLMEEVRRKRGLTYGVYSRLIPYKRAGLFLGSVSTRADRMDESISVIRGEIRRMADHGISDKELADAKTYLTGSYALNFDSNGAIASQLVAIQRYGLGLNYIERRNSYIESVTVEQVQRVAKRLMRDETLFWVVVGKPADAAAKGSKAPQSDAAP